MADGFVPSYQNEEERREEIKQNNKKYRIRTILFSVLAIVVVAAVIVTSLIIANINYSKYEKYEDKMDLYGFSQVYDNGRANTRDKVTKSAFCLTSSQPFSIATSVVCFNVGFSAIIMFIASLTNNTSETAERPL